MTKIATTDLKVTSIDYHRNGIGGEGFYVLLFDWNDGLQDRHMLGVLFKTPWHTAIFDADMIGEGNIAFAAGNSWRGDNFDGPLREQINMYMEARWPNLGKEERW